MAKIEVETVATYKLIITGIELEALYQGLNVLDGERYTSNEFQVAAMGIDNAIARVLDSE